MIFSNRIVFVFAGIFLNPIYILQKIHIFDEPLVLGSGYKICVCVWIGGTTTVVVCVCVCVCGGGGSLEVSSRL